MSSLPSLSWVSASIPKSGNSTNENEDATAAGPATLRFEVADGATEAWQAGGWATHLVGASLRRPPTPADFSEWLATARREWTPAAAGSAWYVEIKQEQGAFATLLGLEFRLATQTPGLAWKAVAVGDSCMLVIRQGRIEVSFPLTSATEFGTRPPLIPSPAGVSCPRPEWLAGRAEPGDLFILASDAVARYLLQLAAPLEQHPLVAAIRAGVATNSPDPVLNSLLGLQNDLKDDASIVAVVVPDPAEPSR